MRPPHHAVGLSLWLVPEEEAHRRLAAQIADLARRFHTPLFEPHLTLLAGFELEPQTARVRTGELAASLAPLRLRLTSLVHEAEYFRAVFFHAEPSPELLDAHRRAAQVFGVAPGPAFRPHLSLLYGDLDEGQRGQALTLVDGRALDLSVRRLELIQTTGPVGDWRRLAAVALSGP
jgi:2'-5' RNA ligase